MVREFARTSTGCCAKQCNYKDAAGKSCTGGGTVKTAAAAGSKGGGVVAGAMVAAAGSLLAARLRLV